MKINIYYGGRGVLDDPTLNVINKMEQVLTELRVEVHRYNIYEYKNEISTLPQTLKEIDGVILATTVEWLGIGGYMNQFLDACWLYGDKNVISEIYMFPIVMSKTYGEKEASLTLVSSWDMLGGKSVNGLNAYVDDTSEFEFNVSMLVMLLVTQIWILLDLREGSPQLYKTSEFFKIRLLQFLLKPKRWVLLLPMSVQR